jgi:predicted transcriptional regulator
LTVSGKRKGELLHDLNRFLLIRCQKKLTTMIVVDEAQHLSTEVLEEIRLLTNLETADFAGWKYRANWPSFIVNNNMCYRCRIMHNNVKTISFRALVEKIDALDSLAAKQDRSRSYLINQAITNYIELHAYQDTLVRNGLEEMRKGRVVNHAEVVKRLKRTGRARQ